MGSLKIDNVTFNSVITEGGYPLPGAPIRWTSPDGQYWSGVESSSGGIINAIDIDWNAPSISGFPTIRTTGQLLTFIKGLLDRIAVLESKIS